VKTYVGDLGIDGRIILKLILKWGVRMWTRSVRLKVGIVAFSCEHWFSISTKNRTSCDHLIDCQLLIGSGARTYKLLQLTCRKLQITTTVILMRRYSGLWRHVDWLVGTSFSEKHTVSIFSSLRHNPEEHTAISTAVAPNLSLIVIVDWDCGVLHYQLHGCHGSQADNAVRSHCVSHETSFSV
jgi:hypothetical protein